MCKEKVNKCLVMLVLAIMCVGLSYSEVEDKLAGVRAEDIEVSKHVQLTTDGGYTFIQWFPDGERLLALQEIDKEHSKLAIIDVKTNQKKYIELPSPQIGEPLLSPDGKKIITSGFVLDLETQQIKRLIPEEVSPIRGRTWSPDSKKLAYSVLLGPVYKGKFYPYDSPEFKKAKEENPKLLKEAEADKQGIEIFDITTGEKKIIYTGVYKTRGLLKVHAWLPSGKIVFTEPQEGAEDPWKYEVTCVIKRDGSEKKIIKKGPVDAVCILNGERSIILGGIKWVDEKGEKRGEIVNKDLSLPFAIETLLDNFSPSGDKLILTTTELDHKDQIIASDLFIADLDGKTKKQITFTSHLIEEKASWSPSGDKIAYIPYTGDTNIYVIFLKKKQ